MNHPARHYHRLRAMFQATLSLAAGGAYGFGCGPCEGAQTTTAAVLPAGNGGDGGAEAGNRSLPELDSTTCDRLCGGTVSSCSYLPEKPGDATLVECKRLSSCGGAGRRPANHLDQVARSPEPLAAWFAETALLERASIRAFEALHDELRAHGASPGLMRRARLAAQDERRHARVMAGLAKSHGSALPQPSRQARSGSTDPGRPSRPRSRARVRSLTDVAIENAVEGCVKETFAALVAHAQSVAATDPSVATVMRTIARDETRHAALAHAVHEWALGELGSEDQAKVRSAYADAIEALRRGPFIAPPEGPRERAGLPNATLASTLADRLATELARTNTTPKRPRRKGAAGQDRLVRGGVFASNDGQFMLANEAPSLPSAPVASAGMPTTFD